jgi:hypothetical protein
MSRNGSEKTARLIFGDGNAIYREDMAEIQAIN